MANLNGPFLLGWVGSQTGCNTLDTYELRNQVEKIFCVNQRGTSFVSQKPVHAGNKFALIKKLECGLGAVLYIPESTDIPYISQSNARKSRLLIPNFPLEIEINGLTSDYAIGNGLYNITTFFLNDAPTYKNDNGWTIHKADGNWRMFTDIVGLEDLYNVSIDPAAESYKTSGCDNEGVCQIAYPNRETTDSTGGGLSGDDDDEPSTDLPEITGLRVTSINDTQIKIKWDSFSAIDGYLIELSTDVDFEQKTIGVASADQTEFTFNNLTSSTKYFFRIKYTGFLGVYTGTYSTEQAYTTIQGIKSDLVVGVSSNRYPLIQWKIPRLNYDFLITLYSTGDSQNWSKVGDFKSQDEITEYEDTSVDADGLYYYKIKFNNGSEGSDSSIAVIDMSNNKPLQPTLMSSPTPSNSKKLFFWWKTYSDDVNFLYKFNDSAWIRYTDTEITIPASEGLNTFKLKAVDSDGNESDEVSKTIVADFTPPKTPVFGELSNTGGSKLLSFNWICDSEDLNNFVYRFNKKLWVNLDKNIKSVELESIQGENTFEIKSVDHVGNESSVAKTSIDISFDPPNKPVLLELPPRTNLKSLRFDWKMEGVFTEYEYRFYSWGIQTNEPESVSWSKLDKSVETIRFDVIDGYNKFEIVSIDSFGNRSESDSRIIYVDTQPPLKPSVKELDFYEVTENEFILKYGWNIEEQYSNEIDPTKIKFKYKFNDQDWIDLENDSEVELKTHQGMNRFKIYAYDNVGNTSEVNTIEKIVDSIPPPTPVITGSLGVAPQYLNSDLWEKCQTSMLTNELVELDITYSFMINGTSILSEFSPSSSRQISLLSSDFKTDKLSTFECIKEVELAFDDWKHIIKDAFPHVIINFINLGIETTDQQNIPSSYNIGYKTEFKSDNKMADIRMGMVENIVNYEKNLLPNIENGTVLGFDDIYIDPRLKWELDKNVNKSSYSMRFAMRHYIGKALRLKQNKLNSHGTMHGVEIGKNVVNTLSSDSSHFLKSYSFPFIEDKKVRVVEKNKLTISWQSKVSTLFEYRYVFISNGGRITTNPRWVSYSKSLTDKGEKFIDVDSIDMATDNLRFYVRSVDSAGNASPEDYIDIQIKESSADKLDKLSVVDLGYPLVSSIRLFNIMYF